MVPSSLNFFFDLFLSYTSFFYIWKIFCLWNKNLKILFQVFMLFNQSNYNFSKCDPFCCWMLHSKTMFATSPIDLQSALRPADNLKKKCISSVHWSTSNFKAAIPLQKELWTICNGQVPMFKNNLLILVKTSVFEILGLHLDRPFQYVANDLYLNCLFW